MHSSRSVLVAIATVTACLFITVSVMTMPFIAVPARADTSSAGVSTDPTGAHVELDHDAITWHETTRRSGALPDACLRDWMLTGVFQLRKTRWGDYIHVPFTVAPPGPEYSVYQVFCDHEYVSTVWLRPQQFGVNPAAIAERLLRDLPYPAATVGTNPAARGLTGLETWFWVQGYTAAPIADTVTQFGLRVEVEAAAESVSWDFGDGTTARGVGLGAAPPARSTVIHTFEVRARPTFPVRALIQLSVRWRLNGGPWQPLKPVSRAAVRIYPVVESRAALVPDR